MPPNLITSPCEAVIKIPIWQVRNWGSENQSYCQRLPYRGQIASAKDDEEEKRKEETVFGTLIRVRSGQSCSLVFLCVVALGLAEATTQVLSWHAVMTPRSLSLQIQCRPRARCGMRPKRWVLVYKIFVLIIWDQILQNEIRTTNIYKASFTWTDTLHLLNFISV